MLYGDGNWPGCWCALTIEASCTSGSARKPLPARFTVATDAILHVLWANTEKIERRASLPKPRLAFYLQLATEVASSFL
eukprot:4749656-Pleurochrysis_carterae.AAC.1